MTTRASALRAGNGQIVHRAVYGKFADGAAGKAQRLDHEAVGRDRRCECRSTCNVRGIAQRLRGWPEQQRREQAFDQPAAGFATGAVRHLDLRHREIESSVTPRSIGCVAQARTSRLAGFSMLVVIVGRARAFGRNHQRADGAFRRALLAEQLALRRFQHALQHLAALRRLGIGDAHAGHIEALLRIAFRIAVANT